MREREKDRETDDIEDPKVAGERKRNMREVGMSIKAQYECS